MDSIMARTEGFQPVCKTSISKFHPRVKAEKMGDCGRAQATENPDTFKSPLWCKIYLYLPHEMLFAGRFQTTM